MLNRSCSLGAWLLATAVLVFASSRAAAQFPRVIYDVSAGSTLSDGCGDCERPDVPYAVTGSFVLQRLPVRIVGELYELTELNLSCAEPVAGCDVTVTGTGNHYLRDPETQRSNVTVSINGVDGIELASDFVPVETPWPVVEFEVTEDGSRDPQHVYTLKIVASPRVERVRYELVPGNLDDNSGSIVTRICPVCRLLEPLIAVAGSFEIGLVTPVDDGPSIYSVENVQIRRADAEPGAVDLEFRGGGTYEHGGDSDIVQRMRLGLRLNGGELRFHDSGYVPVEPGFGFPTISLDIEEEENGRGALWHRIHLLARPATSAPPPFRRGDSNADEAVDIADAVHTLLSLFAGGPAPACLDAADANDSGQLDLSDAVYGLAYLFLGGSPPPAPGPVDCGEAPESRLGCELYPPCGKG